MRRCPMPQLHLNVAHNLRRRALRGEIFLSLFFPFSFLILLCHVEFPINQ